MMLKIEIPPNEKNPAEQAALGDEGQQRPDIQGWLDRPDRECAWFDHPLPILRPMQLQIRTQLAANNEPTTWSTPAAS